jgi:RimJ/RimL family protein N-acetyltransferase
MQAFAFTAQAPSRNRPGENSSSRTRTETFRNASIGVFSFNHSTLKFRVGEWIEMNATITSYQANTLETARLHLRSFGQDDIELLFKLESDPAVRVFLDSAPPLRWRQYKEKAINLLRALSAEASRANFWMAVLKETEESIGCFHLLPNKRSSDVIELGYCLKPSFWEQGLATEGSRKILQYAFLTRQLDCLMAETLTLNTRSRRVLEKLGMEFRCDFVYPRHIFPGWSDTKRQGVRYFLSRARWSRIQAGETSIGSIASVLESSHTV